MLVGTLFLSVQATGETALYVKDDFLRYVGSDIGVVMAYSEYEICNPWVSDFTTITKGLNQFDWDFIKLKGDLKETWFEHRVDYLCPEIASYDETCEKDTLSLNGSTISGQCTSEPVFKYATCTQWKRFNPEKHTYKGEECERIRVYGTYEPAFGDEDAVVIDNVLSFAGYKYDEYAWWNVSFAYKQNISEASGNTYTSNWVNLSMNTSDYITATQMNADCSDLRVVDYSDNPIPRKIINCNEKDTEIWFNYTSGNGDYQIYYGYGAAGAQPDHNLSDWNIKESSTFDEFANGYDLHGESGYTNTGLDVTDANQEESYSGSLEPAADQSLKIADGAGGGLLIDWTQSITYGILRYKFMIKLGANDPYLMMFRKDNTDEIFMMLLEHADDSIQYYDSAGLQHFDFIERNQWYTMQVDFDGSAGKFNLTMTNATTTVTNYNRGMRDGPVNAQAWTVDVSANTLHIDDFMLWETMVYTNPPFVFEAQEASPAAAAVSPQWSNNYTRFPFNTAYGILKEYGFEIGWEATSGDFNLANVTFQANFSGSVTNYTNASANPVQNDTPNTFYINFTQEQFTGIDRFEYLWFATNGTSNTTDTFVYNITVGDPVCSHAPSTQTINFGDTPLQWCSCNQTDAVVCKLWRDAINVTNRNNTNELLPAGTFNFKANITNSTNFTSDESVASVVTVAKAGVSIALAPTTQAITFGTTRLQYCAGNVTLWVCTLWRNEVNVTAQNNTSPLLNAAAHSYKANVSAPAANYSWTAATSTLTVNRASVTTNLLINGTDADRNIQNTSAVNTTCEIVGSPAGGTVYIDSNLTGWAQQSGAEPLENASHIVQEPEGNKYNVTCSYKTTQNYSFSFETHYITVSQTYLIVGDFYPNRGDEGESKIFSINITNTSATVDDINATFRFNNTNYEPARTTGAGWYYFTRVVQMPNITGDNATKQSQWNFTVREGTVNTTDGSTTRSIGVHTPKIVRCDGNTTVTRSLKIYMRNESSEFETVNGTMDAYVTFEQYNYSYYNNWTATNETDWICIFPAWTNVSVDGYIHYVGDNDTKGKYHYRDYVLDNVDFDNTTSDLSLILLIDEAGTTNDPFVEMTVKDEFNAPYPDVVIEVQRWFSELYDYRTVAVLKTGTQGTTGTYLVKRDQLYRFIMTLNGTFLKTFDRQAITSIDNTLIFNIDAGEIIEWIKHRSIGYCEYSIAAGRIVCAYNVPAGYVRSVALDVYNLGALHKSHICSEINTTVPTGYLFCDTGNITGKIYSYQLYANATSTNFRGFTDTIMIAQGMFNEGYLQTRVFGNCGSAYNLVQCREGMIVMFLLTLISVFAAVYHPTSSIVFMLFSMALTWGIGLMAMTMQGRIGLIFVGAVIIYRNSRG